MFLPADLSRTLGRGLIIILLPQCGAYSLVLGKKPYPIGGHGCITDMGIS